MYYTTVQRRVLFSLLKYFINTSAIFLAELGRTAEPFLFKIRHKLWVTNFQNFRLRV